MIALNVFNAGFEWRNIIKSYISLTWQEQYQGRGGFVLILDDTSSSLIDVGDYVFIRDRKTAMIVENKVIDSARGQVMFSGYTTLQLLTKRIIRNAIKITNAETGMYAIIRNNMRGLGRLLLSAPKGFTESHDSQRTWDELLTAVIEIASSTGLGIRMNFDRDNGNHVFEVYRGVDRRITQDENVRIFFGEEFKNIYGLHISDDMSFFKNVAIVAGAGEGTGRAIVEAGTAQGDDRFELYVDARDLQPDEDNGETTTSPAYLERLRSRGQEKLADYIRRRNFTVDVSSNDYGVKYDLGDLVSCRSQKYGVLLHARIVEYSYVVERNSQKTNIVVGDAQIDAIGEMKLWQ